MVMEKLPLLHSIAKAPIQIMKAYRNFTPLKRLVPEGSCGFSPGILSINILPFGKTASERESLNARSERYMEEYGSQILRFAYSYLQNMQEAEDVLQETLIKVLQANPTFETPGHEKAYILKTASNISKNHITANTRYESDELKENLAALENEDLSFVWEAVKRLPEPQREAVHLFYQEGYRTSEISEILNRKESTIRSDLKRAREKMKEILREVYDFE